MLTLSQSPPSYKQFKNAFTHPPFKLFWDKLLNDPTNPLKHLSLLSPSTTPAPPPIEFLLYIRNPQNDHEAPCPAAKHHPTQPIHHPSHHLFYCLGLDTRKYENFILSSYWKRGKYKILYFLDTTPSNTTNSPQQLSPATICFIASVWIREKYENFILSSYWKRGKYKILYFPRFQYEESMSFFKMSGSISIFKQVYQCSKSIPSTSIFLRSI